MIEGRTVYFSGSRCGFVVDRDGLQWPFVYSGYFEERANCIASGAIASGSIASGKIHASLWGVIQSGCVASGDVNRGFGYE